MTLPSRRGTVTSESKEACCDNDGQQKRRQLDHGVGGAEMLPAMEAMEEIDLFAGADIVPTTR